MSLKEPCLEEWTKATAYAMAKHESIELTDDHWLIITTLRTFYLDHRLLPPMRVLIKLLSEKMPPEKNNSVYLQGLFPQGLMRQAGKIAGLPKSARCI